MRTSLTSSLAASSGDEGSVLAPERRGALQPARIGGIAAAALVFAGTLSGVAYELTENKNIYILSPLTLLNGASVALLGHLLTPPNYRQAISQFVTNWSYEAFFAATQVALNVVPPDFQKLSLLPFVWGLGMFIGKDGATAFSLQLSDFPSSAQEPEPDQILKTVGFSARDNSLGPKILLVALAVTAAALTILNFLIINQYPQGGDLGKIGFYQDLIALFVGGVGGSILTRVLDKTKVQMEERYRVRLFDDIGPSSLLRAMRVARNTFLIAAPLATVAVLALPALPNSPQAFMEKFTVGAIAGGVEHLSKKDFENQLSSIHRISPVIINQAQEDTLRKVKKAFAKYGGSLIFLGALTGYMSWVASTQSMDGVGAIITLLVSVWGAFFSPNGSLQLIDPKPITAWAMNWLFA